MDNKKLITIAVVVVIIAAGGAFYGGTIYEKNSLSSQGMLRSAGGANFAGGPGGRRGKDAGWAVAQALMAAVL